MIVFVLGAIWLAVVLTFVAAGFVEFWRLGQTQDEASRRWFAKQWPESTARYRRVVNR